MLTPTTTLEVTLSTSSMLDLLPSDVLHEILAVGGVPAWLLFCQVSHGLRARSDGFFEAGAIDLTVCKDLITDNKLRFVLQRVPRNMLKSLNVSGCQQLTKGGILKALRYGSTQNLHDLYALQVGPASWTVADLRRLVALCPSLALLRVDCRAEGFDDEHLGLLAKEESIQPRRLVLHHGPHAPETLMPISPPPAPLPVAAAAVFGEGAEDATAAADGEGEDAPGALGLTLQRCRGSLVELDARGSLDVRGVKQVIRLLAKPECALRRLVLPGCGALRGEEAASAFGQALAINRSVEVLHLGCSYINATGAASLAIALCANTKLARLELHHNPLLDEGCCRLAHALVANTTLRYLAVPFTGVGDGACAALALALNGARLDGGSALEVLDLAGNRLTADGVTLLAAALPLSRITTLSLSANAHIGPQGTLALAAALPDTPSLTSLSLDGCAVGAAPCGRLAAALARSRVANLDLSSNEIGDLGAWELAWRLPECHALVSLSLAVNEIEEDGAAELLAGILASRSLASIDLRGNRIVASSAAHQVR